MKTTKHIFAGIAVLCALLCVAAMACEITYDDKVIAVIPKAPESDKTAPANVTNFSATAGEGSVTISWTNPVDYDFAGVELSCSPAEGTLTSPVIIKSGTSYSVTGLTNSTEYTFTIKAFDVSGNYSGGIGYTITPNDVTPPADVYGLTATAGNQYVTLEWENPPDADFDGVQITASPSIGEPIVLRAEYGQYTVTTLTNGTQYTFTVKSVDTSGNTSAGKTATATPEQGKGLASDAFVPYKLERVAYDFGYSSSLTTKTITVTAASDMTIAAEISNASRAGCFSVGSVSKTTVAAGEQFTVDVTYTPSATPLWDEADLSLCDDDSFVVRLIGSSFKQPKDIGDAVHVNGASSLRLWLRADMIGSNNLTAETKQVKLLPDYSGNGFDAIPPELIKGPLYKENGINGLPSMEYDSTKYYLISEGSVQNPITKNAEGTSTFVVFNFIRPTSYSTESVISGYNGSSPTFPGVAMYYRYCDETLGYSGTYKRGLSVTGYGYGGTYRWLFGNAEGAKTDTSKRIMESITNENPYSMCLIYDGSVDANVPDPNTFVYVNGVEKFMSYTYSSSSSSTELYKAGRSPLCYGSYGQPMSNGWGGRYGDLGNDAVDTTEWTNKRTGHSTRKNDHAYSYTPYVTQSGASGATYFTNKVTKGERNGTIKTMYIGPNQSFTTTFTGLISEVFVFNRALTDTEIAEMNQYLKLRYNIGE